ncbi:MAG: hypothetical protein ACT4PW_11765 [Acidimicrobiia bacterium]
MTYDDSLDAAVRALPVEDHGPGFWAELDQNLDAAAADVRAKRALHADGANGSSAGADERGAQLPGGAGRPAPPAAGPSSGAGGGGGAGAAAGASAPDAPVSSLSDERARRRRANLARVAAVAAAVVVVAVAVVWNGARNDDRQELNVVVDPPAPEAPRPLTLTASYEVTGDNGGGFRLTAADDGSFAWVGTSTDDVTVDLYYDASTGLAVESGVISRGEVASFVTAGVPAGGPDRGIAVPPPLGSLADAVTAMGRAQSGEVEVATFLDRPVWRFDGPIVADALGGDGTPDHAVVDVDQQTGVALSISLRAGDVPVSEVVATSAVVGEGIDRTAFGPVSPITAAADFDRGFAPSTVEAAGGQVGYPVLVPGAVPEGFRLASVTVDTEVPSTTGAEGSNPPVTDIVSMQWRNGFLSFTVTLRPAGEALVTDPFGAEGMRFQAEPQTIELAGRPALEGELVVSPPARPHLWGRTGDTVVTIDGDLTADDLYQAARSLAPATVEESSVTSPPGGEPVGDGPEQFVGLDSGSLSVFSARTGALIAHLTEDGPDPGHSEPVLVGDAAWFIRSDRLCRSSILKVGLGGGLFNEPAVTAGATISGLAVSADSRMVAWVHEPCDGDAVLRTKDLSTGRERSFTLADRSNGDAVVVVGKPSWAPDGRRLALHLTGSRATSSDEGEGFIETRVLDTFTADAAEDGQSLTGTVCSLRQPVYLADGTLVVLTCLIDGEPDRAAAVRFDPATGERLETLFELEGPLQGAGAEAVSAFDLSPDGRHALYEVVDGEGLSNVYRWDGGTPVRVDTTATQPSW